MGKLAHLFKASPKEDDTGGHQIPLPPPYNDCEKNSYHNADHKRDAARTIAGESSSSQVDTTPTPDPVPAVPDDLITFQVGPQAQEHKYPKAKLCAESKYFRGSFRPGEPNADVTSFIYPDHKPRSYDVITHWFNTDTLPEYWWEGHDRSQGNVQNIAILYNTLVDLELRGMANDVMDAARKLLLDRNLTVRPSDVKYVTTMNIKEDRLLRFCVDTAVCHLMTWPKSYLVTQPEIAEQYRKIWDDQALTKVVMKRVLDWQLEKWDDPRKRVGCHYHDHSDGCKAMKNGRSTNKANTMKKG